MRLPGFFAEISLGRSGERYEICRNVAHEMSAPVQPQMCVTHGNTITCTQCSDGYCWTHTIHIPTLY